MGIVGLGGSSLIPTTDHPQPDPTPAQIDRAKAKIQAGWSEAKERTRRDATGEPYEMPVIRHSDCRVRKSKQRRPSA